MRRDVLERRVEELKQETHDALQTVIDELNHGQRQKIVRSEAVRALLDRYGVAYEK